MAGRISEARKPTYYVGMVLTIAGFVLFASVLSSFLGHFGDFTNFESRSRSQMLGMFGGVALIVAGQVLRRTGARGLAGSGLLLDPARAREDLKPYSQMAGGVLKDVLQEADVNLGGSTQKVVMVKCPGCAKLNEEDSKFCQECGKAL